MVGAGPQEVPAAARSAPRSRPLHFFGVEGGLFWWFLGAKSDAWGPERKASRVRRGRVVLGPSGLRPQCSILGWAALACVFQSFQPLGKVRLETNREGGAWQNGYQPGSFRMSFQSYVQREHSSAFVEANRLFRNPRGWGPHEEVRSRATRSKCT